VYAANWGVIENIRQNKDNEYEVLIRHHPENAGFYTLYEHLLSVEPNTVIGNRVTGGDRIGSLDGQAENPHLHFMWAKKANVADPFIDHVFVPGSTTDKMRIFNCIPLDPTPLLYRFEVHRCRGRNAPNPIHRFEHHQFKKINRIRVLSWPNNLAATWLFEVAMPYARETAYYYLPINHAFPQEMMMADVIRDAFNNGKKIKLKWRTSHFYGERKMIDDVRVNP
jgi:hypothetical protein